MKVKLLTLLFLTCTANAAQVREVHYFRAEFVDAEARALGAAIGLEDSVSGEKSLIVGPLQIHAEVQGIESNGFPIFRYSAWMELDAKARGVEYNGKGVRATMIFDESEKLYKALTLKELSMPPPMKAWKKVFRAEGASIECFFDPQNFNPYDCITRMSLN